jgi:hypothetical protein
MKQSGKAAVFVLCRFLTCGVDDGCVHVLDHCKVTNSHFVCARALYWLLFTVTGWYHTKRPMHCCHFMTCSALP